MRFAKLIAYELLTAVHMAYGPAAPRASFDDMPMMLVELSQPAGAL